MHEVRTWDDQVHREFVQSLSSEELQARLSDLHSKALNDPSTKSIYQAKIGRNDLCPCGSGRKFKKCCISQVNVSR